MLIGAVMDELGARLTGIEGLRVFPYWADRVTPPAAVIGWPDPLTYDTTARRGSDRMSMPISVLVGKVDARTSRDMMSRYADGAGLSSVKVALEAEGYTACDSVRVQSCEFAVMTVAAVEYLSATFAVDIVGSGS